ncbi:TIM barrel protein [candidate division KSB1 bacterium]|nr:TIM barrel protein [candidate division KSB1 bacterium]
MLIGFTVEPYKKWSTATIIAALHRFGVRFVELNHQAFADLDALKVSLRGMTAAFHLPLLEEDGWDFSCIDAEENIERTISILNQHHRDLHIRHVIAHPPELNLDEMNIPTSEEAMFANLRRLPVPVYFENVPSWDLDAFRALLNRAQLKLPHLYAGMCFDAAHFYINGDNPVYNFRAFHQKIGCVHLSDCIDSEDAHLPFGCGGTLPITDLLAIMRKYRYRGSITLEMMPYTTDQLLPFIRSYLLMLRTFHRRKYILTLLRLWTLWGILKTFSK